MNGVPKVEENPIIEALFKFYRQYFYRKRYFEPEFRKYDRVGITTLFTFYWNITIETINFAKRLCKTNEGVMVGGIMASILADRVETETGIKPHIGTLHTPGELDPENNLIIDTLPLDYSILEEIDYKYPASDAYFAYMTRGCVNSCKFCAVPKLEPVYTEFLPVSEQVHIAEECYGAKRDLLLLDNNVLASCRFNDIVDDIIAAGFGRDATYEKAVRTAVRNGHRNLSNYILYNFEDRPVELYLRLKLNVDLCEELGASIYSFPMKYHPIEDPEYFDNRDFVGKHWNRKFIRTIQAILNSTKGKVGRGHDFFCKAFGANEQEYFKLLYMPEAMIIYRVFFERMGLTDQWWAAFSTLSDDEMAIAKPIIEKNVFTNIQNETDNNNVRNVLRYYCITRDDAEQMMENQ